MKFNINSFIREQEKAVKIFGYGMLYCSLIFVMMFGEDLRAKVFDVNSDSSEIVNKLDDRVRAVEYEAKLYKDSLARIEANTEVIRKMQVVQERLLIMSETLESEMAGVREREYDRLTKED